MSITEIQAAINRSERSLGMSITTWPVKVATKEKGRAPISARVDRPGQAAKRGTQLTRKVLK